MNRVFIDMDGVIVDFEGYANGRPGEEVKKLPLAYLEMKPIDGAVDAVRSLIGMGYDVWLATKPPTGVAHAYSAKAQWVFDHLPELKRKLIITPDKGLLGEVGDFLIDDRPHKASCGAFRGWLIGFGLKYAVSWKDVVFALSRNKQYDSLPMIRILCDRDGL